MTFGVPFPAGALWDLKPLRLVDRQGREVPCQKEVTGLWALDGAIKWVRFDALVSTSEGCRVQFEPAGAGARPSPALTLTESGGVTIDTGAAQYRLAKGPSPIASIRVNGRTVATAAGARGLYVMDQRNRLARASAKDETMLIEARGPVAACVRFEGFYRTPNGEPLARHITRVETFAGQAFARVTHTLILTRDTNKVWFKDIGWELNVQPGSSPQAVFGRGRDDWAKPVVAPLGGPARSAFVIQDSHYRFHHGKNHFYIASQIGDKTGKRLAEGEECADWALLTGRAGGLVVSCREAARQHPKEIEISPGKVVLRLFSNRAGEELDFRAPALVKKWNLTNWFDHVYGKKRRVKGEDKVRKFTSNAIGLAKTHELLIAPTPAAGAAARAARLSRLHSAPVYAHVDPGWIYETRAMGRIPPRNVERFPRAEKVIEETFRVWERRVARWGDYGFVDYFAGPHLEHVQGANPEYVKPYRYNGLTYTLRGDLWLAYARSGERAIRAFAEGTNRAYIDIHFAHWDGARKVRGLYVSPSGSDRYGVGKACLPFYWEGNSSTNRSSSTNLQQFTYDYYLTGYRRAKDHVIAYADGLKRFWSPAKAQRDWRGLMTMRTAVQSYAFTWDPELRAIAEATTDAFSDADGELGLTKDRPYGSSTYKTHVDFPALLDAWRITGSPRYRRTALRIMRYWWPRFMASWPIFYCSPVGRIGNFLYHETGDPVYAQVLAVMLRQAATAYDPKTGIVKNTKHGRVGGEDATFVFQGIPYTEDVMTASGADRHPLTSWVSFEDFGYPAAIILKKTRYDIARIELKTAADAEHAAGGVTVTPLQPPTTVGLDLCRVNQQAAGATAIRIPKDAPAGEYRIDLATQGTHFAVAHSQRPLVLYAPEYWQPQPVQHPPIRWYFRVPKGAKEARIFFESPARLFGPDGRSTSAEPARGWVNLPGDRPGLWSFQPLQEGLVRVRNLPPFFSAESPDSYFTPKVAWSREAIPPEPEAVPSSVVYVPGVGADPDNKALYVRGRRYFDFSGGPKLAKGDGRRYLPFQQGTIEFWMKPDWSTFSIPVKSRPVYKSFLRLPSARESWNLYYRKNPNRGVWLYSHVLHGRYVSDGKRRLNIRANRQTVLERGVWTHIAWVWGREVGATFTGAEPVKILTARIYVNGRLGRFRASRDTGQRVADMPKALQLYGDAVFDELRVSDSVRYTKDFTPPGRESELKLDPNTRALFHFNGDLKGLSYGREESVQGMLR